MYASIELAVKARMRLTGLGEQWCRLLVERNMQQGDDGVRWRSDPRLKLDSPLRFTFEQVDALMTEHAGNTLLITGVSGFSQISQLLPRAQTWFEQLICVELEGDHHLHMENAVGLVVKLHDFYHDDMQI